MNIQRFFSSTKKQLRYNYLICLFIPLVITACKKKPDDYIDVEFQEYATVKDSHKIRLTWIYMCAEKDYVWASLLTDQAIQCKNNPQKTAKTISQLKDLQHAVEKIQMPGAKDVIYRDDTPLLGKGDTYLREPLILMPKDSLELVQRLANNFEVGPIRHAAWEYKDGFLESLILLLQNHQLENTATN